MTLTLEQYTELLKTIPPMTQEFFDESSLDKELDITQIECYWLEQNIRMRLSVFKEINKPVAISDIVQ